MDKIRDFLLDQFNLSLETMTSWEQRVKEKYGIPIQSNSAGDHLLIFSVNDDLESYVYVISESADPVLGNMLETQCFFTDESRALDALWHCVELKTIRFNKSSFTLDVVAEVPNMFRNCKSLEEMQIRCDLLGK